MTQKFYRFFFALRSSVEDTDALALTSIIPSESQLILLAHAITSAREKPSGGRNSCVDVLLCVNCLCEAEGEEREGSNLQS